MTGPADQVPLSVVRQLAAALRDALGAIDALSTQVEQMRGMFSDDDGTIAEAIEAGDDADTAGTAALSAWRAFEGGSGEMTT